MYILGLKVIGAGRDPCVCDRGWRCLRSVGPTSVLWLPDRGSDPDLTDCKPSVLPLDYRASTKAPISGRFLCLCGVWNRPSVFLAPRRSASASGAQIPCDHVFYL